ncbi:MAG: uroporphyrinogen-III synthase [Phototrophicales bacterium]|nr:uroporphyrinogen-III synthase [Phototrophicales bacterium]
MNTLTGKHIVITRARHQSQALADLLLQCGAIPIFYPSIAIIPPQDTTLLDETLTHLAHFDWLIITSPNTVMMLQQRARMLAISSLWGQIKMATVGAMTAQALHASFGRYADFIPTRHTAQDLALELPLVGGERVLLPQSSRANPTLREMLTQRDAIVTAVTAYETVADESGDDVPLLLSQGKIDAITFASSSAVTLFVQQVGTIPDVAVACIGDSTAKTAYEAGFKPIWIANEASLHGLITLLERHL